MRIAVVIPALDEEESLPLVLGDLPPGMRIVVVDNGSTDGTARVAREGGAEVVLAPRRGYGTAVQAGMNHLRADPPDVLVILDGDHADDPGLVPTLVEPIATGRADLVLTDRSRTAEPGALTPVQRFGNALATRLIARSTGHRYADMGPFRAIRWDALLRLGMVDPTWGWNVEMQIKAVRAHLRILELPVPYRARARGQSKVSGTLRGAARAGVRILWAVRYYAHAPLPPP
ncbi:MAG: glycosyltransferase family 2 protein [Alphaproteobacteria bacterium]|nr:glycosyltransferase family 2 protein [Alphaproteobacteria bacterium]MCB9696430.1 glycosyltransferase family 2 protein [Alphaproteobacteria bacterium]